jgi:small subunit ribosomal protein S20
MANIASSKKDARRSLRRAAANRSVRSAVRTRITKVRRALGEGGSEEATQLGAEAIAGLDRAASKGVLHRNNAARRKSRLMKRLNAAAVAPAPAATERGRSTAKSSGTTRGRAERSAAPAAKAKPASGGRRPKGSAGKS